ncbi:hypothetical protein TRIP_B50665 [uncultured Desulfatiglans sp.]|uniref:Uncharacterized protein n=1 Tax=Uncultured Desulfatiglans sp. TaxID=1748965 RepID=A0A653AIH4_UNCDX|nr:hypothetical protein TRIP_B50665 [uncultured Desulfatiglans sp.]
MCGRFAENFFSTRRGITACECFLLTGQGQYAKPHSVNFTLNSMEVQDVRNLETAGNGRRDSRSERDQCARDRQKGQAGTICHSEGQ